MKNITKKEREYLIKKAIEASKNAQPHLSHYNVGAAILSKDGGIYTGCNIEFDNYSNTIHAEEGAISCFFNNGGLKPVAIAVYTNSSPPFFPCGMCRQSLFEFGGPEMIVIACNEEEHEEMLMKDLLPKGFSLH